MPNHLVVNRDEFFAALKPFYKAYRVSDLSRVELTFNGEFLRVDAGVGRCEIRATGDWENGVVVNRRYTPKFFRIVKKLPMVPHFVIRVAESNLYVAGTAVPCKYNSTNT